MSIPPAVSQSPDAIEISTIKLNLNGLVVELKVEEARKLWAKLNELFGPQMGVVSYGLSDPLWVEPHWPGGDVKCNAYTGNTLELR